MTGGVSTVTTLSLSQVQQSSFYGYTGMLPKRYTQGVMTGESEYLQTPGVGAGLSGLREPLPGTEVGLRSPWHLGWECLVGSRGGTPRNLVVKGVASLVNVPLGCEAQVPL